MREDALRHLVLAPLAGDRSIVPPDYKFGKMTAREYPSLARHIKKQNQTEEEECNILLSLLRCCIAVYTCKDKREIVGYVTLVRDVGRPTIGELWVHPEYRRKRIGWTLLNLCMLRAEKETYLDLHAYAKDSASISYLQRAGFREVL